ncbi:hypothetical protein MTO96_034830 [Rhipicephalus appendiculatus]
MSLYNVTVAQTFYTDSAVLVRDMFSGVVDVHRNLASANPVGARDFHIPAMIAYWYESFYAKRYSLVMLPLRDILEDSKFGLSLIFAALLFTLTFLVLAEVYRGKCWSTNGASDSLMFLLASLYSTSHSVPRIGNLTGRGRFVCGLWLLAMVPFGNYFQGEMTSRETLPAFPEHIDTLAELERTLDEKRVAPCVVKDTFLHERLLKNISADSVHRKLRLSFQMHPEQDKLLQSSYSLCLKCALREDRICYTVSLPSWFRSPYKQSIVESRERFRPVILTFAVRKNYPRKVGLRQLIRKVAEAGLMRPPEEKRRQEILQNYDERISLELSTLRIDELAPFLYLFMALLAMTAIVGVLEILTQRS